MKCNVVIAHAHSTGTGYECENVFYIHSTFGKPLFSCTPLCFAHEYNDERIFECKIKSKHLIYVLFTSRARECECECMSENVLKLKWSTIRACNYMQNVVYQQPIADCCMTATKRFFSGISNIRTNLLPARNCYQTSRN